MITAALQPDGKVVIGGQFTTYNGTPRSNIARLNADGSLDASFNPGSGTSNNVFATALQPDGKLIIGGQFTSYNGTSRNNVARLNADGSLDASFNPGSGVGGGITAVQTVALQPNGKVVIGGQFTSYNGTPRANIARLNADGSLDTTFNSGTAITVYNLAIQRDGKILIGGDFASYDGVARKDILRITGDFFVTWAAGDASDKTISLPIVDDSTFEPNETLTLTIIPLSGGATTGANPTATLTIVDNETSLSAVSGGGAFGGTATLTATLASGAGNLSGKTVSFTLNGAAVCGVSGKPACPTTDSQGAATLTGVSLSGINSGTFPNAVGAAFAGDASFAASSGTGPLNVSKADTTTALSSSANPSSAGQPVTFTATVSSATTGTPTGSVQFKDNGANLGLPQPLNSGGVATLTTSALTAGAHAITADYGGDSNFNSSSGALAGNQVVGAVVEFSQALYTVAERGGSVSITVRRAGDTSSAVSVDYATDDGSTPSVSVPCSSVTGLALERCDYTRAAGTLSFAPNETQKSFTVLVNDDSYSEGAETTHLRLSKPGGGAALGQQSSADLQITDDSPESSGNPVDDSQFFVRQHYHDFLNREPDADGLQFWTQGIESCGADSQCREVKRINTSAAFFLSIEFQETGYLVERIYKAAYGDATGSSTFPSPHQLPVPVIRLGEFLSDRQRIGRGVVVGQGAWRQQLEDNKQAFGLEFVSRQRFTNVFPASMSADTFVHQLDRNAGQVLADEDVAQLEGVFGGPSASSDDASKRAQVLRAVAENAAFQQRETNRAFVLMQYFGYLRRNPDDAQDTDYTGYDFWLRKLDQFHGNFVQAEMVKAFIQSTEYRQRFGQ